MSIPSKLKDNMNSFGLSCFFLMAEKFKGKMISTVKCFTQLVIGETAVHFLHRYRFNIDYCKTYSRWKKVLTYKFHL